MSPRDTIRVIQPGHRRIKVFVDFWNVVINARQQAKIFDIEVRWDKLADQIVAETHRGYGDETSGELAGCYIFGSYSKSAPDELAFIKRTLDNFGSKPGLYFEFTERVTKQTAHKCSKCGTSISHSSELGVDVLLTVEMIKHASMGEHEYIALVSSDRDYVPLLTYLRDQGQRVLHVSTGAQHRDMRSLTWKQIDLHDQYPDLCSISSKDCLIFTTPCLKEKTEEAKAALTEQGLSFCVINIADKAVCPDKDLRFLLRNQPFLIKHRPGEGFGWATPSEGLSATLYALRTKLLAGEADGSLPYVVQDGQVLAYCDDPAGWIANSQNAMNKVWTKLRKSNDGDRV